MAKATLKGIRGWLAALLVAIGVIGPLYYGLSIRFALSAQDTLARFGAEALPLYRAQTVIWSLSLFKLALAWSIAGAMLRFRTRAALRFAIAGIWLLGVGTVFFEWAGFALAGWEPETAPLWLSAIVRAALGLVLVIPATLYLLRSHRVANTYPAPGAAEALATVFE